MPGQARVGCSGWSYRDWRGVVSPADAPPSRWFQLYAERFDTVEINNTFYRLPPPETVEGWARQAPPGFTYAVKLGQFGSHRMKLRDAERWLPNHLDRVRRLGSALGPHLGPVLYQLPGTLAFDLPLLDDFLAALPRRVQHVVEFRHPSWYVDATFDCLERRGASLCLHDKEGSEITEPFVGRCVYVRFHGTTGRYHGSYSPRALADWAERLVARRQDGLDVYAYFNNDPDAVAVQNAMTLRRPSDMARDEPRLSRVR